MRAHVCACVYTRMHVSRYMHCVSACMHVSLMLLLTYQCLLPMSFSPLLARSPWLISSSYTKDSNHTRFSASCTASLASFSTPSSQSMAYIFELHQRLQPHTLFSKLYSIAGICSCSVHAKEGASNALPCSRRSPNPCSVVAASSLSVNSFERYCFNSSHRDHDKSPSLSFPAEIAFASLRACLHWSRSLQHLTFNLR